MTALLSLSSIVKANVKQYDLIKLPYALTAWVAATFCAPALGPLLSGFAVTAKGWRW